jgi:hypothetical protein
VSLVITGADSPARYLPNLDPEWIQLSNVPNPEGWKNYRASFEPEHMQVWPAYPPKHIRQDAEWLLSRARDVDPVGADWSRLMRCAPAKSRKDLKDAALVTLDARIAAGRPAAAGCQTPARMRSTLCRSTMEKPRSR